MIGSHASTGKVEVSLLDAVSELCVGERQDGLSVAAPSTVSLFVPECVVPSLTSQVSGD